ncbi:MAG: Holliday junction resolvase RuvX [Acidobacteria bacterium]|nr:Holliday junction resolvase RuvX [Acidobacteriota bacterium]
MSKAPASEEVRPNTETGAEGRILAIDLGERRMGLALSDPLRLTAQGLPTVERRNRREDMNYLKSLARRNDVSLIVVGNPINMDGTLGAQSAAASEFGSKLHKHLQMDVRLWDERLTSVEANRILRESGLRREERAKSVDQVAAVLLLESFLEAQRVAAPSGPARDE